MLEHILELDRQVFVFLNGLGSTTYDPFWLFITKQYSWTPLFVVLLFLMYKKLGTRPTLFLIVLIALLITVSDQTANLFKYIFERLRPCSEPLLKDNIRIVKASATFGFFSAHASTSMAVSVLLFSILKQYYRYLFLIFAWPLLFGYSRIYLSMHYPGDILAGYTIGLLLGLLFYKLYQWLDKNYFST
ncbi:MAG TPA: phosphatase PAP2 family protein [Flavobacterium sp.]|jgi:undecaprenyl-diphosphatase